jgi:hypothetical protein
MWNKYDMTPSVAINATQLIAIEAATVRQRVNAGTVWVYSLLANEGYG